MPVRTILSALIFTIALCAAGCPVSSPPPVEKGPAAAIFSLEAKVKSRDGSILTLAVNKPAMDTRGRLALKLARGIIDDTYLIEGRTIRAGEAELVIERLAGDKALARIIKGGAGIKAGDTIRIYLDRKTIAITDLTVINASGAEFGRYVQEELTTALVRSGQFRVLEREQLGAVLKEISLNQSGMVDRDSAKKAGRLLGADLILTGTMTRIGDDWSANLRLINTETGLVLTAINQSGPLSEISKKQLRKSGNINATFEAGANSAGWNIGERHGGRSGEKGFSKVHIDDERGARLSRHSLRMDFHIGKKRSRRKAKKKMFVAIRNSIKRDLSMFSGIKFHLRSDKPVTVTFVMTDNEKGRPGDEHWWKAIETNNSWQEIVVPFRELAVNRKKARRLGTDQIFDRGRIERIDWQINESHTPPGTSGTVWLDEVYFY